MHIYIHIHICIHIYIYNYRYIYTYTLYMYTCMLPSCSVGKESACNAADLSLIPGLGRSPGEGNGYLLQYSGLENSVNCIVHGVAESFTFIYMYNWVTGLYTWNLYNTVSQLHSCKKIKVMFSLPFNTLSFTWSLVALFALVSTAQQSESAAHIQTSPLWHHGALSRVPCAIKTPVSSHCEKEGRS